MCRILFLSLCLIIFPSFLSAKSKPQIINLVVTENGFEPGRLVVKPNTHVVLKITRKTDSTCATEIVIKEKKINKKLPLDKEVTVDLGKLKVGEIKFACAMNMIMGEIIVK